MFEIGNYVLNATNGICKINEVVELDMSGDKVMKSYFLLRPVESEHDKVYIPVDKASQRIRKVISKDEALAVIDSISSVEVLTITNEKEREAKYKEAVRSCEPKQIIGLLKCLFIRNEERMQQGKRSTAIDERYLKMAENNLYSEFAFALEKDKKEISEMIQKAISK